MRFSPVLLFLMVMFCHAWRRWCFETEFSVSNVAAGVRDVTASAQSDTSQYKCAYRDRERCARPFQDCADSNGCHACQNVKEPDHFLPARHMLIEPLLAGRVGHRFDAIVCRFPVLINRPRRNCADKYEHERSDTNAIVSQE